MDITWYKPKIGLKPICSCHFDTLGSPPQPSLLAPPCPATCSAGGWIVGVLQHHRDAVLVDETKDSLQDPNPKVGVPSGH